MARTFNIDIAASPSSLLKRARMTASENGVRLVGNEGSGRFSHEMLEGEYRVIRRRVIVTVTHKPRLVPWSVLDGRLRGLFDGGPRVPQIREESTAGTAHRSGGRRRATRRPPYHHHRRHPPRR